jgi:hypothetical protein
MKIPIEDDEYCLILGSAELKTIWLAVCNQVRTLTVGYPTM